jgi:glycosyltransferase involved in cell wall biosynthesis
VVVKIVVQNAHADKGGGGYYSLPLIRALSVYGQVQSYDQYLAEGQLYLPDLFVCIKHTQPCTDSSGVRVLPGRKNIQVCYYPLLHHSSVVGYDGAICLGDWIAQEQALKWGLPYWVIYPAIDLDCFRPREKRNLILSVGTFFYDKGHSKNQLAVLKWFLDDGPKDWEIVFVGDTHNSAGWYYDAVAELVGRVPGAGIVGYLSHDEELYRLYGEAKFLVHANGATGNYPWEVEHFGIVAIEAMAAGCQPIVHDSGGCAHIPGVRVWRNWHDIGDLMDVPVNTRTLIENAQLYSFDNMLKRVGVMLRDLDLI